MKTDRIQGIIVEESLGSYRQPHQIKEFMRHTYNGLIKKIANHPRTLKTGLATTTDTEKRATELDALIHRFRARP